MPQYLHAPDSEIAPLLWRRLDRSGGPDACWPLISKRPGYTLFSFGGQSFVASRLAWSLANQREPDKALKVCHKCDNPPCCNPNHLFLGTQRENIEDAVQKGRIVCGEKHHKTKLTADRVLNIRRDTRRVGVIAAEYGISRASVYHIRNRATWKHVQAA